MSRKTMITRHDGGMRFSAADADGLRLVMDEREGGGGPSPIETLLASLGGCTGMDVVSILRKKRQEVGAYSIETVAEQREEYPKVFTRVDVTHAFEGGSLDVTAVRRAIELSATRYCTVSAMLCAGTVEVHHRFRVTATDGQVSEGEVVVRGPGASPDAVG